MDIFKQPETQDIDMDPDRLVMIAHHQREMGVGDSSAEIQARTSVS